MKENTYPMVQFEWAEYTLVCKIASVQNSNVHKLIRQKSNCSFVLKVTTTPSLH